MSKDNDMASGTNNNPEYIAKVQKRVVNSSHEEAVCEFLMIKYHVRSIDELLRRRGVYTAIAQIDILLDELEKNESS